MQANVAILAIVIGGALFGDGILRKFEQSAADQIAAGLQGQGKKVKVQATVSSMAGAWGEIDAVTIDASDFWTPQLPFFVEPLRSKRGKIGTLSLRLRDFTIASLLVKSLRVDIPNCRFDFGLALKHRQFVLSESGRGEATVTLEPKAVEAFILKKYREISSVSVKVDRDKLWIEGEGQFLLAKSTFQIIASLETSKSIQSDSEDEGTRLNLVNAKVYFDWQRADPAAADAILKSLNPVVDLDRDLGLHHALSVRTVRLRDGIIVAEARAKIPILSDTSGGSIPSR